MPGEATSTDFVIKPTGDRIQVIAIADHKLGIDEKFRQERGLVWHHHQDCGRMQLIKKLGTQAVLLSGPHCLTGPTARKEKATMNFSEFFSETAEPADDARLAEIEHAIDRKLTGGGTLKLDKCVMPGLPEGVGRLSTDDIFGNGTTTKTHSYDLAAFATHLMEEWEIPKGVILFATTEDGIHNCFGINYDLPDYPAGTVLHLDTDPSGKMTQIADSVTGFLTKTRTLQRQLCREHQSRRGPRRQGY